MNKRDYALDAAQRGLRVFPQVGKRPSIKNWPGNATAKPSVIERWWTRWPDADIGIALDADLYVLDADSKAASRALRELGLPLTLTVKTSRGEHRYFRVPHELRRMSGGGGSGLAAIEGKGAPGPVTYAGSVHADGARYSFGSTARTIADMPLSLVEAIGPRPTEARQRAGEATPMELADWAFRHARALALVREGSPLHCEGVLDGKIDLRLTLSALRSELPLMAHGWADRLYRAAAYVGPHVASGALSFDSTLKELTALFTELDTEGSDPEHALRSIARGLATGARDAE